MPTGSKRHSHHHSAAEKYNAALRVIKGESVVSVAEEFGVPVNRLERWNATFLTGGMEALERQSHRKTFYQTLRSHSKSITQWAGMLLALLVTVLLLLRFLNQDTGQ